MEDLNSISQIFLQQKLTFLNTLANIGMTWWVSAIVFCGSILAATWLKRNEVIKFPLLHLFCFTVMVFLITVVSFGIWMSYMTFKIRDEVLLIISSTKVPNLTNDFKTVAIGYLIGTSSFTLVLFCWIGLWRYLLVHRSK